MWFVVTYNQHGKEEAAKLARDLYNLSFQQTKCHLERQTDYIYERASGGKITLKILEPRGTGKIRATGSAYGDDRFRHRIRQTGGRTDLRLGTKTKQIYPSIMAHTVIIDKKSLIQDGFQVVEK